jgi:protein-tyrosine phosphatase
VTSQSLYLRLTTGPAFVQARYGSARGLARLWLASAARHRVRRYRDIDWRSVERLVFVCTGNICRSPYAQQRAARSGFPAISVALRGSTGDPANEAAVATAWELGIDLSKHRSLTIHDAELTSGDLLVAMEPWQADALFEMEKAQVTLLGLWSTPQRPHLHDPHKLCRDYFRTCFRLIDSGVEAMLARLAR